MKALLSIYRQRASYLLASSLLAITTLVTSCKQTTDDLFPSLPSERISQRAQELQDKLTSAPEGWLLEYVPGRQQEWGGYHIGLKFSPKGEVLATTELLEDPSKWLKSLYVIGADKNLSINFDVYNEAIHMYSTPDRDIAGGVSLGFEGDYEFNITDMTSSPDTIWLQGKKTTNKMRMYRLKGMSIDSYISDVRATKAKIFNVASMSERAEDALVTADGKRVARLNKEGFNVYTVTEEGSSKEYSVSYFVTPQGIRFVDTEDARAVKLLGDFSWVEETPALKSATESLTARRDPLYDKYVHYLGNYTLSLQEQGKQKSYEVRIEIGGYRKYRIVGGPFDMVASYNTDEDALEIKTQTIATNPDGSFLRLCPWDAEQGSLTWGSDIGMLTQAVEGESGTYILQDNGNSGQGTRINAFIVWTFDANGNHTGAPKDRPYRYTNWKFIKK